MSVGHLVELEGPVDDRLERSAGEALDYVLDGNRAAHLVWSEYWHYYVVVIPTVFAIIIAVWFTWGGLLDVKALFRKLASERINPLDNGTVTDGEKFDLKILNWIVETAWRSP